MALGKAYNIGQQDGLAIGFCQRGELSFGENGAVRLLTDRQGRIVKEMDDYEIEVETRPRYLELATMSSFSTVGSVALLIFGIQTNLFHDRTQFFVLLVLAFITLMTIVSVLGCYSEADANGEVGTRNNNLPGPAHITGLGGTVAILLTLMITVIFVIGQWQPNQLDLPGSAGNGTLIALGAIFVAVFLSSRIPAPPSFDEILGKLRVWTSGVQRLGRFLSKIDAVLVFGVAPLGGLTLNNSFLRYFFLLTQIFCGGLLAWYCPTPFGLLGAGWVFLLVFSIVRRWGWIEHVRAKNLQSTDGTAERRIGHIVDLRDEAMVSLMILVLVMPIAMRQVHLAVPAELGFSISTDALDNIFAWTGFFGVELLKALPFLDWADIYGARNGAQIHTSGPVSMHSVFIARMVIDLVFLAALIQWVSISVSIEKNKRDFLAKRNGVTRLDERIERNHLSRLVKLGLNGEYEPTNSVTQYKHYDRKALSRLRLRYKYDTRLLAAIREIAREMPIQVPSEELLEEAHRSPPRGGKLMDILKLVEQERDFNLENLLTARSELNRKGRLEMERKYLVQMMVKYIPPTIERDKQFAKILSGPNADSLRDVRRLVIDTLVKNAKRNPDVLSFLRHAAEHDNSNAVKAHAKRSMLKFGISFNEANPSQLTA